MSPPILPFAEIADRYCDVAEQTPSGLRKILLAQREKYHLIGWMLLQCQVLDSSYMGSRTLLPYGPANTYKEVPAHPVSPRGRASDQSVVEALLAGDDPLEIPPALAEKYSRFWFTYKGKGLAPSGKLGRGEHGYRVFTAEELDADPGLGDRLRTRFGGGGFKPAR